MSYNLRGYQDDFVLKVRVAFRSGFKSVLLVAATGAGKTVVFSYIARGASAKGNRVLILAHRDTLIKQASRKLTDYGVQHGIIMAAFTPNPIRLVQCASVQTLIRRIEKMLEIEQAAHAKAKAAALAAGQSVEQAEAAGLAAARKLQPDIIVIDEAHLSAAASYMKIRAAWPDAKVLGVTGSPIRLDGKGLGVHAGGMFETLIQGISIKQLIEQAYLVKPVVYGSKEVIDLALIKKVAGDYDNDALADLMDKPRITGSAIEQWRKICPGVPAVAWCVNVAHAKHVAEEFNAAGIPALALSGEDDPAVRERALAAMENGTLKIITFAMLLVEGVDCPAIGAVICLRPSMSLASYLQVIGRSLRTIYAEGMPLDTIEQRFAAIDAGPKGRIAYVLDHASLWMKHGFADQEREWSLDGVPKKKGKKDDADPGPPIAQCEKCYFVFDPKDEDLQVLGRLKHQQAFSLPAPDGALCCPACGHAHLSKVRKIEHDDGELVPIDPELAAEMEKRRKKDEVKGAKTLAELQAIGAQRGYSAGWAQNAFDARARARDKFASGGRH
jgi:DNA repair protein RadD